MSKDLGFDILSPPLPPPASISALEAKATITAIHADVVDELTAQLQPQFVEVECSRECVSPHRSIMAALQTCISSLTHAEQREELNSCMREKFTDCFPADISLVSQLPDDVLHHITLKDAKQSFVKCTYDCPQKY